MTARPTVEEIRQWLALARKSGVESLPKGTLFRDGYELFLAALDLLAEARKDTERLKRALDLIDDLRPYTRDWDWKYGEEWDKERAAIDARLPAEPAPRPCPYCVAGERRFRRGGRWFHDGGVGLSPFCEAVDAVTAEPAATTATCVHGERAGRCTYEGCDQKVCDHYRQPAAAATTDHAELVKRLSVWSTTFAVTQWPGFVRDMEAAIAALRTPAPPASAPPENAVGELESIAVEIERMVFAFDPGDSRRVSVRELAARVRALPYVERAARESEGPMSMDYEPSGGTSAAELAHRQAEAQKLK